MKKMWKKLTSKWDQWIESGANVLSIILTIIGIGAILVFVTRIVFGILYAIFVA